MTVLRFTLNAAGKVKAHRAIDAAEDGADMRIGPPKKSRIQEERYHAMIGDIARQWEFCNRLWDAEDMKRLLIDQFRRDTIRDDDFTDLWKSMGQVEMAPAIDGSGVVAMGIQSRRFPKKLATAFIDWLYAFGAERDVVWTDPTEPPVEAYAADAARA